MPFSGNYKRHPVSEFKSRLHRPLRFVNRLALRFSMQVDGDIRLESGFHSFPLCQFGLFRGTPTRKFVLRGEVAGTYSDCTFISPSPAGFFVVQGNHSAFLHQFVKFLLLFDSIVQAMLYRLRFFHGFLLFCYGKPFRFGRIFKVPILSCKSLAILQSSRDQIFEATPFPQIPTCRTV